MLTGWQVVQAMLSAFSGRYPGADGGVSHLVVSDYNLDSEYIRDMISSATAIYYGARKLPKGDYTGFYEGVYSQHFSDPDDIEEAIKDEMKAVIILGNLLLAIPDEAYDEMLAR